MIVEDDYKNAMLEFSRSDDGMVNARELTRKFVVSIILEVMDRGKS